MKIIEHYLAADPKLTYDDVAVVSQVTNNNPLFEQLKQMLEENGG